MGGITVGRVIVGNFRKFRRSFDLSNLIKGCRSFGARQTISY